MGPAFMLECNVKHDLEGNPLIQHRKLAYHSSLCSSMKEQPLNDLILDWLCHIDIINSLKLTCSNNLFFWRHFRGVFLFRWQYWLRYYVQWCWQWWGSLPLSCKLPQASFTRSWLNEYETGKSHYTQQK